MATTALKNRNSLPEQASTISSPAGKKGAPSPAPGMKPEINTTNTVLPPPPRAIPVPEPPGPEDAAPSIAGSGRSVSRPEAPVLPGTPGATAPPAGYLDIFKDEQTKKAEAERGLRQENWVQRAIQGMQNIFGLMFGGDEAWSRIDLPKDEDQARARRTTLVNSYLLLFHRDGVLPTGDFERNILRRQVADLMFNGRGAQSDEAFLEEMKKDEEYRRTHSDKHALMRDGRIGLHEHLRMLAQHSALPGESDSYPLEIRPLPAADGEGDYMTQRISWIVKRERIFGKQALGKGRKVMEDMEHYARLGRIFEPAWRDENADAMYRSLRDRAAMEYGLSAEEIDDVIRHRVDAQAKDVSRDAFGEIHFKNRVVIQGVDAMRRAVEEADLSLVEKQIQLDGLPERFRRFQEAMVAGVMKDMPELAAELGVKSVADYHKITAVLNDNVWKQGAGGALAAADSTAGDIDHLLGKVEGVFTDGVPYMQKRAEAAKRRGKANGQINELSYNFYREQTSFLGVNAAIIGQGVWAGVESYAMVAATAPLVPAVVTARYGRLAIAFNAAAKVAPAAGIFGIRQGFAVYDQAIAAGKSPDEAMRLAWCSGLIEGATTTAFSGLNAGGIESIASGSARQAARDALRGSLRNAWQAGAKEFGKGVLGEIGEEQLIAALDLAIVQAQIRPGMTSGEFTKRIYDTTIATLFASAGPSALHGAQFHKDVVMENAAVMDWNDETNASGNIDESQDDAVAGSIRTVNPNYGQHGYSENCVHCVIATEQRFAGDKGAAAAPSDGPRLISEITRIFGGSFEKVDGKAGIEALLKAEGDGTRGIVLGTHPARKVGHVWNVRIDKGIVRFLDSQQAEKAGNGDFNFAHYTDFRLLITKRGKSKP